MTSTLEDRVAALEAKLAPISTGLDANGTPFLLWGDITPTNDSGAFKPNYVRGMPDLLFSGREAGAPYAVTCRCGSMELLGANDGVEISANLSGNPDRAGPYTPHAGAQLKINGRSWDPAEGWVTSAMLVLHTEELTTLNHRPGFFSGYSGKAGSANLSLGFRLYPGGLFATRPPLCSVYSSTNQATSDGDEICLAWDRVEADTADMHEAGNPSRLYARVPGVYLLWAYLRWASVPSGDHAVTFRKNSAVIVGGGPGAGGVAYGSTEVTLDAGEYIDVWAYQAGGNPDVLNSSRAGLRMVSL